MSNAGFNAQMATSDGVVPERDLILGFTRGFGIGAPGMVALSKVAPAGTTFAQADLAGPWRVYLQRVESKLAGGTWQLGVSTFGPTGTFIGATLEDVTGAMTTLSTGGLVVADNGAVTGTLANGTAATATTSSVTFTGPTGSGVTGVPADRRAPVTAGSFYETDTMSLGGQNLIGNWSVRYRGVDRTFTVTDPQTATRFVAMLPTVTLNAAQTHVTAVSWVFKNRGTGATIQPPAEADAIQFEFTGFGIDYASPDFPRTVTSHTLPTPLPVANLEFMYISFKDTATGHFYVTTYTQ